MIDHGYEYKFSRNLIISNMSKICFSKLDQNGLVWRALSLSFLTIQKNTHDLAAQNFESSNQKSVSSVPSGPDGSDEIQCSTK